MIPQSFIQDLLNRVDIVDAVDRYVPLKKAGANFIACCPFHSEKTPSFTVSPSKQFYHCFGCGAHGNAISFLIEFSGLNYVEAVHQLAAHAGMQVPAQQIDSSQFSGGYEGGDQLLSSQNLLDVLQTVTRFYREQLKLSERAIAYLKKRGISGQTAARFAIGYAPAGWQNLETVFSDYSSEETRGLLVKAGLVIINDEGKQYDRFRDRIMFPILNQKGEIIGFGGRVLEREEPKYLNSPETALFEKGRELYNFFSARRPIREANRVLVVEGYMDVVALSQHGIDYAVATLGTATTGYHIQKLLRQSDKIVFSFDGDKAGRKAAWRALENSLSLLTDDKVLNFLFLPEGMDPDNYVNQYGKEAFEQQVDRAIPLSEFLFRELCANLNLQTSEGRARLVSDAKPLLQQVTAPALSLILLRRLEELCGINENELRDLLQVKQSPKTRVIRSAVKKQPVTPCRWIIMALLHHPEYVVRLDRGLLAESSGYAEEIAALQTLIDFIDKHPNLIEKESASSLLAYLQNNSYSTILEKIESETLKWNDEIDLEAEFMGALDKLQQAQRKKRMTELHSKPLNQLTEEEKRELQQLAVLQAR